MPNLKKKISKAKADIIKKDIRDGIRKEIGPRLSSLWPMIVDEAIMRVLFGVLSEHFEIVEVDADEIGNDFQI